MYEVYLEKAAERDLNRLDPHLFARMISQIRRLKFNPRPHGCKKLSASANDWRLRVGDYRILYEIQDNSRVVRIIRIRHRRDVYR